MNAGYFAASTFLLFTGTGTAAQVIKLLRRRALWRQGAISAKDVCSGLIPTREGVSFAAYLFFALSGLTRSYLDLFLLFSRLPVVILSAIIVWILSETGVPGGKTLLKWVGGGLFLLVCLMPISLGGLAPIPMFVSTTIDLIVSVIALAVFYGKMLQTVHIYRTREIAAVSSLREGGILLKDLCGLWYAVTVGSELFWIGMTHVFSGIASSAILLAKRFVQGKAVNELQ